MSLSNYEIVSRISQAQSMLAIAIANTPVDKPLHLARFANTVKEILAQRDDTDITDARCGNCGSGLFQPGSDQ